MQDCLGQLPAVMPCRLMAPDDGNPASFKEILVDPLMGRSQ